MDFSDFSQVVEAAQQITHAAKRLRVGDNIDGRNLIGNMRNSNYTLPGIPQAFGGSGGQPKGPGKGPGGIPSNGRRVSSRNNVGVIGNGGSIVAGVSKRRKKPKKNKPLKRIKRIISKAIKSSKVMKEVKLNDIQSQYMYQIATLANKVEWELFNPGWNLDQWLRVCHYEAISNTSDGVTIANTVVPSSTVATLNDLKFKIKALYQLHGKNNTNSPCELVIYFMKCNCNTDAAAIADLDFRLARQKKTTVLASPTSALTSAQAKEDDYYQYWSTPHMKDSQWDIKEKKKIYLQPGDEIKVSFSHTFSVRNGTDVTVPTAYQKGFPQIIMRLQGVPSHDATAETNCMMSPSQVDFLVQSSFKTYKSESAMTGQMHLQTVRTGFTGTTAVLAEDEEVAPYSAG